MNDYMRIQDLKNIIADLPDDMLVIIPVVDVDDVDSIIGFRKVRTAGVLVCESESDREAFCLNSATLDSDISDQVPSEQIPDIGVKDVLYGRKEERL